MTSIFDDARAAGFDPIPLHAFDATRTTPKGVRKLGKAPRDAAWTTTDYQHFDAAGHLAAGKNVGLRPRKGFVVLDVDPRNHGDEGLAVLKREYPEIMDAPRTRTGGGGWHIFLSVPEDRALASDLRGYPGIEVKGHVRQVVALGSRHPDTGHVYKMEVPFNGAPPMVPDALLPAMIMPARKQTKPGEAGKLDAEQLQAGLAFLDPDAFRDNDKFFQVAGAAHHATGGDSDAMTAFLDWARRDSEYDTDYHAAKNEALWQRLTLDRGDGNAVTYKTLLQLIAATGAKGKAFVARVDQPSAADDFPDDDEPTKSAKGERRYVIRTLDEIFAMPDPEFQVADFIPEESVTMVYGAPKVSKTFVVIDIACRIGVGMDFYRHTVRQGRVLYVASEGGARIFGKRVRAWLDEHSDVDQSALAESLLVIEDSVALNEPKSVATFLTDIAHHGAFALIVFDTLLANNSGDVNSNEDMGALMRGAHHIRRKKQANVLIVHILAGP